jgi:cytochrome b subunit of formate dehydrogenase
VTLLATQQQPEAQPPFDYQKWIHEMQRADAQRAQEIIREDACRTHDKNEEFHRYVNKASIAAGQFALRMALLINGGAAIALLTFVGTLPKEQKRLFADTLVWFASGVVLAVAALALAYFTNYFMAEIARSRLQTWDYPYVRPGPATPRYTILNRIFHVGTVLVGLASLATFVCGMLRVRDALTHLI